MPWSLSQNRSWAGLEANENTAEGEDGLMDVGAAFVADGQPSVVPEPSEGPFEHPSVRMCCLAPGLPRSVGVGPTRSPPFGRDAGAVEAGARPVDLDRLGEAGQQHAAKTVSEAGGMTGSRWVRHGVVGAGIAWGSGE
jgi:hypothetical protein